MNRQDFVERKEETAAARVLRHSRRRLADVAANLSRKGEMQGRAEIINEAVSLLIQLCYEKDEGYPGPANVDPAEGRILIPVPWGRNGRYKFGLRNQEGDVLREHFKRLQEQTDPPPLFTYDPLTRSWYLNFMDYRTSAAARAYWERAEMDAATYRAIVAQVRNG